MPQPLVGPLMKLERAKEHIDQFERELDLWTGQYPRPYRATPVGKPKPLRRVLRFHVREAPTHLGTVFGDAVVNLRASLDHLVYQLALRYCPDGEPSIRTAFPIYNNPYRYPAGARDRLQSVMPEAWDLIECLQPYNRATWSNLYYLWLISELANRDKHKAFNFVAGRTHVTTDKGSDLWLAGPLQDGDHLELRLDRPEYGDYTVTINAAIGVLVENECIGPDGLRQFHDLIRDDVLPLFAGFFDQGRPFQRMPRNPRKSRRARRSRGKQR